METTKARWAGVLLVCKDCPKRSSGPKKVKAKAAASQAKQSLKQRKLGVRVVRCSCLGICPKNELVIASADGAASRWLSVRALVDIDAAVQSLAPSA